MVLDIILIAIVLLCIYFGYKHGFVRTLQNLSSFVLSIIIALLTYGKIAELISNSVVGKFIREKIFDSISVSNTDFSSLPDFLQTPLESGVESIAETVSANMSIMVISIISIVLTIVVSKFLLGFLFKVLNVFAKMPLLKQCNRLLGIAFGALNGYFWVCIVLFVVTYLSNLPNMELVAEMLDSSNIALFLSDNNLLAGLFPVLKKGK